MTNSDVKRVRGLLRNAYLRGWDDAITQAENRLREWMSTEEWFERPSSKDIDQSLADDRIEP